MPQPIKQQDYKVTVHGTIKTVTTATATASYDSADKSLHLENSARTAWAESKPNLFTDETATMRTYIYKSPQGAKPEFVISCTKQPADTSTGLDEPAAIAADAEREKIRAFLGKHPSLAGALKKEFGNQPIIAVSDEKVGTKQITLSDVLDGPAPTVRACVNGLPISEIRTK